jgi:sulfatase maturation enzyme AslB (radical SAM superfamily)
MLNDFLRYFHFFKQSSFGLNLPKGTLLNYLKIHYRFLNEKIGPTGKTYPAMSYIIITKRCNLNCSFCSFGRLGAKPPNWEEYELTPKKFERLLDLEMNKKLLMIVFGGGEPLLNKDLPEFVHMASKRKYLLGMATNGLLLENRSPELFKNSWGGEHLRHSTFHIRQHQRKALPHTAENLALG